jgi:hypothetical protein
MIAPTLCLNVKQNANKRQGSAVVGTFKEDDHEKFGLL